MTMSSARLLAALLASSSLLAASAAAQGRQDEAGTPVSQAERETDVIVVDAVQRRGVTLSNIEPEIVLNESDIEAFGVSSLAELLQELAPETSSGRSRRGGGGPVVLLNGRRISGFREIGRYPPEALARVEVLPEEAALSYGFNADQRVINFVLKPNVVVRAAEAQIEAPEAGGNAMTEYSFQRLAVDGSRRFSVDLRYKEESQLLESERDFDPQQPREPFASPGNLGANDFGDPIGTLLGGDPALDVAALGGDSFSLPVLGARNPQDEQAFRSLRPEMADWSLGFSRSSGFFWDSVLTLSGEYERAETTRLLGLGNIGIDLPGANPFVPYGDGLTLYTNIPGNDALLQERDSDVFGAGISVVSRPGRTNWTFTGSYEISDNETLTETGIDLGPLQAQVDGGADPFAVLAGSLRRTERLTTAETRTASAELVVNAKTLPLPAGDVQLSAQAGVFSRELDTSVRDENGTVGATLSRETFSTQFNIDVPLMDSLELGSLSVNANVNWRELSDFGSLTTWGGGFNYRPSDKFRILASYTVEEGAPGIAQIGDPLLVTPNVRVFDFTTGETVLVEAITGGNPDLLADTREIAKLGLQFKPWDEREVTLNIDYTQSAIEDEARDFPALTAEVEAAIPERFTRNAAGDMIAIDQRPVNFSEATQRQVRTGLNWSRRIESPGGSRPGGPPPGGGRPQADGRPASQPGSTPQTAPPQAAPPQAAPSRPQRSRRPGRMSLSLTHVWVLEDTLLIREGLPELDLLDGSAVGQNGGTSEHQIDVAMRRYNKGVGTFARVSWQSGTDVNGELSGGDDLQFSDLLTADIRVSYDLTFSDRLMDKARWLKDTRVSFGIDNMFDQRPEVRNQDGATPVRYQPDVIDPLGRVFEVELRKRF